MARTGSPVRVVVYGVGEMGSLLTRLLVERGATVVGAIGRSPEKVGRDLGSVAGLGRELGVRVSDDPESVLRESDADIALVAVASYLETMAPHFRTCLSHGVDVLTLEEEAFYPWRRAPALAGELDQLARSTGATLAASGVQDVFWTLAASALLAGAHRIERVRGRSTWNADDYGPEVAGYLQLGRAPAQAQASVGAVDGVTSQTMLEALAACAGLTPVGHEVRAEPVLADAELDCRCIGGSIPRGAVRGIAELVRVTTAEGVDLEFEMAGFVHASGESCVTEWQVDGEPRLRLRNDDFPGRIVTCTTVVNRVPDVLAAPPGLLTVDRLPSPRYRPDPFGVGSAMGAVERAGATQGTRSSSASVTGRRR